jgi:predicted PurR-regulated permease PerM
MPATLSLPARKLLFWSGFFLALGAIVWLLGDVLLPFILGVAIAYLLNPVCEALARRGVPRTLVVLFLLTLFSLVVLVLLALLVPVLVRQFADFAAAAPGYIDHLRATIEPYVHNILSSMGDDAFARLRDAAGQYAGKAAQAVVNVAGGLWSGGAAIINVVALLLITPIVAFYIMRDWPMIVAKVDSWLPRSKAEVIRTQLREMDRTLAGFVRGQSMVCVLLATYYAIALAFVGLNFGLVIGLIAGLLSFIPFVGSTFGLVTAAIVALVQFDGYTQVAIVIAIFMFAQFMEGNVIAPKLIGESVGLHPVWIIFALMAGGALFGFVGLLLAIPVAAVLGVLIRFGMQEYLDSPFYKGGVGRRRRIAPL